MLDIDFLHLQHGIMSLRKLAGPPHPAIGTRIMVSSAEGGIYYLGHFGVLEDCYRNARSHRRYGRPGRAMSTGSLLFRPT